MVSTKVKVSHLSPLLSFVNTMYSVFFTLIFKPTSFSFFINVIRFLQFTFYMLLFSTGCWSNIQIFYLPSLSQPHSLQPLEHCSLGLDTKVKEIMLQNIFNCEFIENGASKPRPSFWPFQAGFNNFGVFLILILFIESLLIVGLFSLCFTLFA